MQHSGSFKARGAFAHLLGREIPAAGVVAASGGNHGAAVAYAAMRRAVPAKIFVPSVSSPAKIARIRDYGAELVVGGDLYADALRRQPRVGSNVRGALEVHAFDHPMTVLGQGTLGREFAAQAGDLDTVLVAVGGGGLIGGVAAWHRGRVKVVGRRAGRGADAARRARGRGAGRCAGGRSRGRFPRAAPHRAG